MPDTSREEVSTQAQTIHDICKMKAEIKATLLSYEECMGTKIKRRQEYTVKEDETIQREKTREHTTRGIERLYSERRQDYTVKENETIQREKTREHTTEENERPYSERR